MDSKIILTKGMRSKYQDLFTGQARPTSTTLKLIGSVIHLCRKVLFALKNKLKSELKR